MEDLVCNMHDEPGNSYKPLARIINKYHPHLPDPVLSFLLGIITHIHVDSSFHPFIFYFSGRGISDNKKIKRKDDTRHHYIETFLDLYYNKRKINLNRRGMIFNVINNMEIEEEKLLELLSVLYDLKINNSAQLIKKALKCHAFIYNLFDKNWIRAIYQILNIIPGIHMEHYTSLFYPLNKPDYNLIFSDPICYTHPVTGKEFLHSIEEIEEQIIVNVLKIFKLIESSWKKSSLKKVFTSLKGPNLCTGITGACRADMQYFNTEKDLSELIFK